MIPIARRVFVFVLCVSAFAAMAQPRLVKDLNPGISPQGSTPFDLGSAGNVTFFLATHPETGRELWKTDGTESGTRLVRDMVPGPADGFPEWVHSRVVGNRLVFYFGTHLGGTFWTTDGTYEGTIPLTSLPLASGDAAPTFGPVIGSTLYFSAHSAEAGKELWRTDGTPAGTRLVVDLFPGTGSSYAFPLEAVGSRLLFSASPDGVTGGWYVSDGTATGTQAVGDFHNTTAPIRFGGAILFRSRFGNDWRVIRTDGTADGTTILRGGFTTVTDLFAGDGVAYFTAADETTGRELWKTDGTAAGTVLVADLTPGPPGSDIFIRGVLGRIVIFLKRGTPSKLWASDGTAAGTRELREVSNAFGGKVWGNHLYYTQIDATYGHEVWKTDGTPEGTTLVADIRPGPESSATQNAQPAHFTVRPDGLFFMANDGVHGSEPFVTNGTPAGTRMIRNVAPDASYGSFPERFGNAAGRLVFNAFASQLWSSDGTDAGTSRLNIPGVTPGLGAGNGALYYFHNGPFSPSALWRSDGTVAGTFALPATAYAMTPFKGGLFFVGTDAEHGVEPWFTDGTVAGTRMLKDVVPGTTGSGISATYVMDANTILFVAELSDTRELWLTDGTPAGTRRLAAVSRDSTYLGFIRSGSSFFALGGPNSGSVSALWRIDPVTGAFSLVRQFLVGHSALYGMWNAGGAMLFAAGTELWRSDGTEAGTVRVAENLPPSCWTSALAGDGVLYWYSRAQFGDADALWRSDGTPAGTFRLADASLAGSCSPDVLHFSDGRLYFSGVDPLYGREPWVTDGTVAGTRLLGDVNPGSDGSDPTDFLRIGRTLFFSAHERSTGKELWAVESGCDGECPPRRRRLRH